MLLRQLTASDLGWFAAARESGRVKGNQRGINFNSSVMQHVFPPLVLQAGEISVCTRRLSEAGTQERRILLQEKNWRLVGDKVVGDQLDRLQEGDLFVAELNTADAEPYFLVWQVVMADGQRDLYDRLLNDFKNLLNGGMGVWGEKEPDARALAMLSGFVVQPESQPEAAPERSSPQNEADEKPPDSPEKSPRKRKRIESRLQRPHILVEIVKRGMVLSAEAQANFIATLEDLSSELRQLFLEAELIKMAPLGHKETWARFRHVKIGFVDGGMANVASIGSAPMAIRVGSYMVTPGVEGPEREQFGIEIQLVDDLYQTVTVYEDSFEDLAKLRDAARICSESAGVLSLTKKDKPPDVILLHGPLVNPISPYAIDGFPSYQELAAARLLPGELPPPTTERERNFVSLHLRQLRALFAGTTTVAGVVERTSTQSPGMLMKRLLAKLRADDRIDDSTRRRFENALGEYRITDSIIFECVLEEGEYIAPEEIDKQEPENKIPQAWFTEIKSYPAPLVTYVKSHPETIPVRVESFKAGKFSHLELMQLVIHMSRLLPKYSFPVGLDIVDKHAKVPEWMSKQFNSMLSAQLMRQAMDSKNPAAIRLARRVLSANSRDWLFRPDFRRN